MKRCMAVVMTALLGAGMASAQDAGKLVVDLANGMTFGKFTYEDTTIDIESEIFNPRVGVEFQFADSVLAIGGEFSMSDNTFTGEYKGGNDDGEGTVDVERTEYAAYVKLRPSDNFGLRVGYRSFKYDLSNADIIQRENGIVTERDMNGTATGDLTTGIDAQLNLGIGDGFRVGLMLGYTYFMDAEYEWAYDEVIGGVTTPKAGKATADAHSVRIRPEVSIAVSDNIRIYADYTLWVTAWSADVNDNDPEYPGYDLYTGVGVGVRCALPL